MIMMTSQDKVADLSRTEVLLKLEDPPWKIDHLE